MWITARTGQIVRIETDVVAASCRSSGSVVGSFILAMAQTGVTRMAMTMTTRRAVVGFNWFAIMMFFG